MGVDEMPRLNNRLAAAELQRRKSRPSGEISQDLLEMNDRTRFDDSMELNTSSRALKGSIKKNSQGKSTFSVAPVVQTTEKLKDVKQSIDEIVQEYESI